ncbi:MAG: hypothetical protein RLZZ453_467 [Chlamydiota bacterium]|jgi:class 3 adenylate cyclase/HAMP domain-containing protein
MGLRYRLFLWISTLFVVVATCFYFVENRVTHRELKVAESQMRAKIFEKDKERMAELQEFVTESIAESIVRIDAVLHNILRFSPLALRFSPIHVNEEKGSWEESVDLLIEYKWISFLQNTAESKVVAMIAPGEMHAKAFYQTPFEGSREIFWVYLKGMDHPYLGIHIPYFLIKESSTIEKLEQVPGDIPVALMLFDPQQFNWNSDKEWGTLPIRWTEGYALNLQKFSESMHIASQKIKEGVKPPSFSTEDLEKNWESAANEVGFTFPSSFLQSLPQEKILEKRLEEIGLGYTQLNLLWIWVALFESGLFGDDLFAKNAPLGIGMFNQGKEVGFGIQGDHVFLSSVAFDDAAYYNQNKMAEGPGLANSFALIPFHNQLFLGNTAQFVVDVGSQEKKGYLTLAVDTDELLSQLVLAIRRTVVLTYRGQVFGAFDEKGGKISTPLLPFEKMQAEPIGLVDWKEESYFYIDLHPFADEDLHLFVLNPEKVEFSLLKSLEEGAQSVANVILFNIHVAGLIVLFIVILILHNVSKKITEPIVELADATKHVVDGHYDKIILKGHKLKHRDEVFQLYDSFQKMITGLKEKEHVKGILNKVVSSEIAEEILKGGVHLGGEEKKVTVLFADIRGFTQMTQHQKASEVIEMLNTCMTKLSQVVDKHHGVIDKYVGDAVMALFGAPVTHTDDALNAVQSAIEMVEALKEWNQTRSVPIEIGIGIHTGLVCAGNMGAANRLNYTVIGCNVNLAARLCGAAKPMQILISKETLDEVKEKVHYETLTSLSLKGFDTPVPVYSISSQG